MTNVNAIKLGLLALAIAIAFLFQTDHVFSDTNNRGEAADLDVGEQLYAENCASCHGADLEGQPEWRSRGPDGKLPAPPHDRTGHTWHHPDSYLFLMTKYGIEDMIGKTYPNKMPAYKGKLTDEEILAALSYIKSTWSSRIQRQHDQINARAKVQ